MKLFRVFLVLVLFLFPGSSIKPQSKDEQAKTDALLASKRFRTKAGLLNFVEGDVLCSCKGRGGARSEKEAVLTAGDIIKTGDGRAEVLLNPGYYLRLSPNSEVVFMDLAVGNLKLKVLRGSVIIEIAMYSESLPRFLNELRDLTFDVVTVITPSDEYAVMRGGAYRFDVKDGRESRVTVFKGEVVVAGTKVKDGQTATLISGNPETTSTGKQRGDAFDDWSRERGLKVVQANQALKHTEWYKLMRSDRAYLDVGKDSPTDLNKGTISALTGGVTHVEKAFVRKEGGSWQELTTDSRLMNGDHVRTAEDCRAEIGPYPYFYLFLKGNTEIVYSESPDGNVSVRLIEGSIVVLVNAPTAKMNERNVLKLLANNGEYEIERSGYYRLDVLGGNRTAMLIYEGSLRHGGNEIGASKQILTTGESVVQSSLKKDAKDSFDIWTERRMLRPLFTMKRKLWHAGAWFLNPETNDYTFVPGGRYCKSPYGGQYSVIYNVHEPTIRPYRPPLPSPIGTSNPIRPNRP